MEHALHIKLYREVEINNHKISIYKISNETTLDDNIYYTTFNGKYAIRWRDIIRIRYWLYELEEELGVRYNIECIY